MLAAWAFAVLVMVAERDLGSSLLFFTLFVVMLWVATERVIYLFLGAALFFRAAVVSWRLFDHVKLRVDIWLDRGPTRRGRTTATRSSRRCGVSDGGLMGTGLGRGSPDIVPVAESDFIFTSIGEELGMFGAAAVLMSYLLIVGAGCASPCAPTTPSRSCSPSASPPSWVSKRSSSSPASSSSSR